MTIQALIDGGQLEEPIVNTQSQPNDGDGDGEQPDKVVASFDIAKAFYSLPQHIIREVIGRRAPSLMWIANTFYGADPASIAFNLSDGSLRIEKVLRGVLPGDPSGTAIMCMVLNDKMTPQLAEEFADVTTVIFADDHHSIMPLERLGPFIERFQQLLARIGCKSNITKCKVMAARNTDAHHQRLRAVADPLGIAVVEGMIITGYPVSPSRDFRVAWVDDLAKKVANEQAALVRALEEDFHSGPRYQALLNAVRQTAAASFLWAARALPPSITQAAAERLDGDIRDLVYNSLNLREPHARLNANDQSYANARLALGMKHGGMGLARCEQSITGAYLGGVVDLARTLARHSPTFNIDKLLPSTNKLYRNVVERGRKVKHDSKVIIYNNIEDLAEKRRGKAVHHAVTKIYDAQLFKEIIEQQGQSPRTAHLIASQGKTAAAALLAAPR